MKISLNITVSDTVLYRRDVLFDTVKKKIVKNLIVKHIVLVNNNDNCIIVYLTE